MNPILLYVAQIGVFVFCFLIFVRNLDESLVKRRINRNLMTKIVTAYVLLSVFGALFAEFFVVWMLMLLFFGQILNHFVQKLRHRRIENTVLVFVQHLILNISAGNSFKTAYFHSISKLKRSERHVFQSFWEVQRLGESFFPGPNSYELSKITQHCRKNSGECRKILNTFREGLQKKEDFRQKVQTTLSQIYTQLAFIGLFYLILVFLTLKNQLYKEYLSWVCLSFSLFSLGSYFVFIIPRRFKWLN